MKPLGGAQPRYDAKYRIRDEPGTTVKNHNPISKNTGWRRDRHNSMYNFKRDLVTSPGNVSKSTGYGGNRYSIDSTARIVFLHHVRHRKGRTTHLWIFLQQTIWPFVLFEIHSNSSTHRAGSTQTKDDSGSALKVNDDTLPVHVTTEKHRLKRSWNTNSSTYASTYY